MPQATVGRPLRHQQIQEALARSPVVALLGARQCGKTTLARELDSAAFFDLHAAADRQALAEVPEQALGALRGLVVLDEIQTMPGLLPVLRVLADRPGRPAQFLILGSASPDLIQGAAESLAGRVAFVDLTGFAAHEVEASHAMQLWHRGGFPRSFLAADDASSYAWRQDFIDTFLTRDAAQFGIALAPEELRRFWTMVAHLHGATLNASELARGVSVDQKTASRYVDILTGTYLVRRLPPWFVNTKKRLVKAPKVYVRDSGILHALLGLRDGAEVLRHPRFGFSWEGFALEQVIAALGAERDASYWGVHNGPELDLVVPRGGRLYGFECKFASQPESTRSMLTAIEDLGLERLFVVYPGDRAFELRENITALPLASVQTRLGSL